MSISIATSRLNLTIRSFTESDITERYVCWLNDPDINKFLEVRHITQTFDSVKEWVLDTNSSPSRQLLGVFFNGKHIGNTTFYNIDKVHKCLRVSICLGLKEFHGRGYGLDVLKAVVAYVFNEMGFNRIEAGIYRENQESINLFTNAGFQQEAVFRERLLFEGRYCDMLLFVLLRKEWLSSNKGHYFNGQRNYENRK